MIEGENLADIKMLAAELSITIEAAIHAL